MSEQPSSQSDLDDNTNVLADAVAAHRENHMLTEGAEPISLWVILGSAIVVLIGGGVLFGGGSLFEYKNFVKPGYVRGSLDDDGATGPKPKPAMAAYMKVGQKLYSSCAGCHQPEGEGNTSYPPLANSEWVTGASLRPALIILNGCKGPIEVNGTVYDGIMPPQGSGVGPKELAGLLNFIRNSFGNKSDKLITLEMAQDALDVSEKRAGGPVTAQELNEKYNRDLEGAELDPNTLVNPKTLEPTAAE